MTAVTAAPTPPRPSNRKTAPSANTNEDSDGEEEEWLDCLESPANSPKRPSSAKSRDDAEEKEEVKKEMVEEEMEGIVLDGMLGGIFGVYFLPFHEDFHGERKIGNERRLRSKETSSTLATSGTTIGSDGISSNDAGKSAPQRRRRGGDEKDEADQTFHSCINQLLSEDEDQLFTHSPSSSIEDHTTNENHFSKNLPSLPPPLPLAPSAVSLSPTPSPSRKKGLFRKKRKSRNLSDIPSISDENYNTTERTMIITDLPPTTPSSMHNEENESMQTLESATPTLTNITNAKKKKNIFKRTVRKMKKRNKRNSNGSSDDVHSTSSAPIVSLSRSFDGAATTTSTIKMPPSTLPPEQQVEETLRLIRSDFIQIETHKSNMSKLQSKADETSHRASKINKNISTLSSTLQELHTKLKILEDNLMSEQAALNDVNSEMDQLVQEEKKQEEEIQELKDVIDVRTNHMSNLLSKTNVAGESAHEGTREGAASFLTAYEGDQQIQQQQDINASLSFPSTISSCDSIKEEDEDAFEPPSPLLPKGPSSPEVDDDEALLLHEQEGLTSPPNVYRKSATCPAAIDDEETTKLKNKKNLLQERSHSSFMRTHDLDVVPLPSTKRRIYNDDVESFLSLSSHSGDEKEGGTLPSTEEKKDIMQLDGKAPLLLEALTKMGYECATDEGPRWTPTSDTKRILSKRKEGQHSQSELSMAWSKYPWHQPYDKKEIFLWSGKFDHGGHGCDLPVIKTRGIIHTKAKNLVELIVDSGRVKEYNSMALGRTDEFFFQEGLDTHPSESILGIGGEAKLIRSLSKPPLIKKPLEFFNAMHARKLSEEKGEKVNGYVCVTRSVWENEEFADSMSSKGGKKNTTISTNTTRSELLLGVNIMRDLEGEHEGWCELTTISHLNSPGVPLSLGKRIGLSAASNNIRCLQAIWE